MPNRHFLTKAFEKIGKIDKQDLEQLAVWLRREERFLRRLLDYAQEGILVVSPKLEVHFSNRSAQLVIGGSSLLRPHEPLVNVVDDAEFRDLIEKTIRADQEIFNEFLEIFAPRHLHLNVTIRKLNREYSTADQNEWKKFYLISFFQKSPSDEKASEQARFDKLNSIISLANGIAHEIGNPLNSINIHLRLLLKDIEQLPKQERGKLAKTVQIVSDETKRLDGIIRHFLKASRRKPVQFQLGNIHDVIKHVLELLKPELDQNLIVLKTSFDSRVPAFFFDHERLNQVYLNLIKNAIQAMPQGGKLIVSTQLQKKLCVTKLIDNGIGISRKNIPKIFDAYYTTKEEGSGLGLIVAYQIINEHGGKIDIVSKTGEGTIANVLLPIRTEKLQLPSPVRETLKAK